MRYDRVAAILEQDPLLKISLGAKDQEIIKRNKEKHLFSRGVVAVTNAIHQRGMDAHSVDRSLVLNIAAEVLGALNDKPNKLPKLPKPAAVKPAKPVVVKPVVVKAPAAPKPKPVVPKVVSPPKQKPVVTAKPKVAPTPKKPAPIAAPTALTLPPSPIASEKVPVYYVYATGLSLVLGLRKIMEMDQTPGFEERQQKVDSLYQDLYKLRDVAVPIPLDMMPPTNAANTNNSKS